MYAVLLTIVTALYAIILVDFSFLFKDISVNSDIISSAQALYSAEGAIEQALFKAKEKETSKRVQAFSRARGTLPESKADFLTYNKGALAGYLNLQMNLTDADLLASEGFNPNNQAVRQGVFWGTGETPDEQDQKALYGLEPVRFKSFAIRNTEENFNKITFEYNKGSSETSDLLFEVISFPREGDPLNFLTFKDLKENPDFNPIQRAVLNTKDGFSSVAGPGGIKFASASLATGYNKAIEIIGFQSLSKNYIIQFQTLDNKPIQYKIQAYLQNAPVPIAPPGVMQTVDVIGGTTNGLFQRIKFQRQTEEGLMPGLNFAHFVDGDLHK